jgi:hypothetical protein
MGSRIKITLPEHIAAELDELADAEGEPVARVTARMVRERLVKLSAGDPRVPSIENPARAPSPSGWTRDR